MPHQRPSNVVPESGKSPLELLDDAELIAYSRKQFGRTVKPPSALHYQTCADRVVRAVGGLTYKHFVGYMKEIDDAAEAASDNGSAPRSPSSRSSATQRASPQRASCDEPYAERYSHLWNATPAPGVASRRTPAVPSPVFETRAETRSMAAKKKKKQKPRGSPGGRVRPPDGEW